MAKRGILAVSITMVQCFLLLGLTRAQLSVDYYSKTCPNVEDIVRKEMTQILSVAPSLAGPLLRMHFHDCFVRVCLQKHNVMIYLYHVIYSNVILNISSFKIKSIIY
jgi:hypothetical protein